MRQETIAETCQRIGLERIDTGGGFSALYLKFDDDGSHVLITDRNDFAPSDDTTEPQDSLAIGIYDGGDHGEAFAVAESIPAYVLADVLGLLIAMRDVTRNTESESRS